jgi:hypothetical protein
MIGLTIAGSLLFGAATVHAQTDTTTRTLNQQPPTQTNQYRTDSVQNDQQGNQQYQDTRNRSRTTGSENNDIQNTTDSLSTYGSQGTTSGSTPYDTTGMSSSADYNSSSNKSSGVTGTEPTGDGSENTSGTTGTGPTGASTSGAPGRPRYEGSATDSKDRADVAKQSKKISKKNKSIDDQRAQK